MKSLADILQEAMIRNEVGTDQRDAYLRVTVSRGAGDIGLDPALCSSPTVVVMAKPLVPPASHLYETGVQVIVASTKRNLPSALSPQIKSTNFLNNIQAKREAIAAGAFDSILLNWEQHLTECTISNVFLVLDGTLRTPALECGLLDGITRMIVIQLARELDIHTDEGRYTVDALVQGRRMLPHEHQHGNHAGDFRRPSSCRRRKTGSTDPEAKGAIPSDARPRRLVHVLAVAPLTRRITRGSRGG